MAAKGKGDSKGSFVAEQVFPAHEARASVLSELHARPVNPVSAPRQIYHFAVVTNAEEASSHREALNGLIELRSLTPMKANARHHQVAFGDDEMRWEEHTEFTTYTFSVRQTGSGFTPTPPAIVREVLNGLPGEILVATRIALRGYRKNRTAQNELDPTSLCISSVADGRAIVSTDLKPNPAGFTRFLIDDKSLSPHAAGALVQRVLEIETYRCFALLGLPEAQRLSPRVRAIEEGLGEITGQMQSASGLDANRELLDRLTGLATQAEAISAESAYRFGAVAAYEGIVHERLEAIQEDSAGDAPTISTFLARRMGPAMRTVTSMKNRIDDLSEKLARAASLLRARVDVELESQNRTLLEAMNRRARLQLRLQQTVEGLSVAAVSYYIVGLVNYIAKGGYGSWLTFDPNIVTAVSVPLVIAVVWMTVRRIRRGHTSKD